MISSTQTNHPLPGGGPEQTVQARVETACNRLREAGLRITQPRIAILKVLIGHEKPVSIEQIHIELSSKSCDLVTVYRCLAAFEDIGLVRRSFFHNGASLYEIGDRPQVSYHVVAKDTGDIRALEAAVTDDLAIAIAKVEEQLKSEGYTDVGHIVEFFAKSPAAAGKRALTGQAAIPAPL